LDAGNDEWCGKREKGKLEKKRKRDGQWEKGGEREKEERKRERERGYKGESLTPLCGVVNVSFLSSMCQ
jgi:hypothetical protein